MDAETVTRIRDLCLRQALDCAFSAIGELRCEGRNPENFFGVLLPETRFALLCACAFTDPQSSFYQQQRLPDLALQILDRVSGRFLDDGRVGDMGDMNSPFFCLLPFTQTLLRLNDSVPANLHERLTDKGLTLYRAARGSINCTHDYLNPRGMEAASALGLYQLAGGEALKQRASECLNELLSRQYASGAQPYHTGGWIWGRKPSQAYQLLTATTMLYAGRFLQVPEADAYVHRLLNFVKLTTTWQGETMVYCFEGLHKSNSRSTHGWIWPLATALAAPELCELGHCSFLAWHQQALDFSERCNLKLGVKGPSTAYLSGLENAALLQVQEVPAAPAFIPESGTRVLPDISTVVAHAPRQDVCMTLLTGYSAFAQAVSGSVKLLAVTPELTDQPDHNHCGTDPVRLDWQVPSEQDECRLLDDGRAVLRGRVFTKWDTDTSGLRPDPAQHLHQRELQVQMDWDETALTLEFQTRKNLNPEPVVSRLLLLLLAEPADVSARIELADGTVLTPPPATTAETESFLYKTKVQALKFLAPDGSGFEIIPEATAADRLILERPLPCAMPVPGKPGLREQIRPANEGSIRLAFDGENVFDHGRFVIKFIGNRSQSSDFRAINTLLRT